METPNYTPSGFSALTPMLAIRNCYQAIDWYRNVFNAEELYRLKDANGKVMHAEIKIKDSILMIAEEELDYNISPETLGGTSIILNIYVPDVDKSVDVALKAGAQLIFPVNDQFYGDRAGRIKDPFGHMWIISTHLKDVQPKELQKQMNEMAD